MRSFGRRLPHTLPFPAHPRVRQGPGGKKTTVAYRNRHVRCVRLLFRLLFKRGLILSNLAARIPEYRDPRKLSRGIMDKDQVTRLLQAAHLTTPTGFRDRTIFEVLYSTGLRGGELCKLTLYEVNLPERMLRVVEGKGRKDRVVPVGKVAASYLAEYIKTVRPILLADKQTPVVFVTAQGEPFKTTNLRQQFILHRGRAGPGDLYTVHSLRHTCATEMLKGGASIRHVQELLGHAPISTTQIYTHVVQTDLKKAHARTTPSERRQAAVFFWTAVEGSILKVDTIQPDSMQNLQEIDDGDGNPKTRIFVVPIAQPMEYPVDPVTVRATITPNLSESELPAGWTLQGGIGSAKLTRTVSRTISAGASKTEFTFSCGGTDSSLKTTVYVYDVKAGLFADEGDLQNIDVGHSWGRYTIDDNTRLDLIDSDYWDYVQEIGFWPSIAGNGNCAGDVRLGTGAAAAGNSGAIVLFSNEFDKVLAALIIATGMAAAGMQVSIFFTFWGLSVLRKNPGPQVKKSLLSATFGWILPKGARKLALSKMHMAGMGTAMMKHVMASQNVASLPDMLQNARAMGVKFIACDMAMGVMGITREELIDVDEVAGVATFIARSKESGPTLFI